MRALQAVLIELNGVDQYAGHVHSLDSSCFGGDQETLARPKGQSVGRIFDNCPSRLDNCQTFNVVGVAMTTAQAHPVAALQIPSDFAARETNLMLRSSELMGVRRRSPVLSRFDVHMAIVAGDLAYSALFHLIDVMKAVNENDITRALGISGRTLRRHRETPKKAMPPDLASKTWSFAETLARAAEVFGAREEAEQWLTRPALGLDGQRPVDMLQTAQGTELVNDFLTRLEYNVYS